MKSKTWGKKVKCKRCGKEGGIEEIEGRLFFQCYGICQLKEYLKTYNMKKYV